MTMEAKQVGQIIGANLNGLAWKIKGLLFGFGIYSDEMTRLILFDLTAVYNNR